MVRHFHTVSAVEAFHASSWVGYICSEMVFSISLLLPRFSCLSLFSSLDFCVFGRSSSSVLRSVAKREWRGSNIFTGLCILPHRNQIRLKLREMDTVLKNAVRQKTLPSWGRKESYWSSSNFFRPQLRITYRASQLPLWIPRSKSGKKSEVVV